MRIRLQIAVAACAALAGCATPGSARCDSVATALAAGLSPLAKQICTETLTVIPNRPKSENLFDAYDAQSDSAWARNWTRKLDFSGVAWDSTRTATLISPRHVVLASHYARQIGDAIVFHNKRGRKVVRFLTGIRRLDFSDIAVGLLDSATDLTFYRVLAPSKDHAKTLVGAFALVTDQGNKLHIHEIRAITNTVVAFKHSPALHKGWGGNLIVGASGNPSFLLVDGELLLLETHTIGGPGAGPFYSSPKNIAGINQAMADLGAGHQLSLVNK